MKTLSTLTRVDDDPHIPCLPHDLVRCCILIRLPVKSLCRFKCVSMLWNSTISDPVFAKSHFVYSKQNSSSPPIIGLFRYSTVDPTVVRYDFLTKDDPHFYHYQTDGFTRVIGHSRGLFCFRSKQFIMLFNPSTREFLHHPLPPPPPPQITHTMSYGFGFDPLTDQYKVVQIVHGHRDFYRCMAYTFGAENNSWRDIPAHVNLSDHFKWATLPETEPTGGTVSSGRALFVNGTLFWFFRRIHLFVAFNIHRESFSFFEGPKPREPHLRTFLLEAAVDCRLIEWQGCLCLICQHILGDIVHLYKYKPMQLPDANAWHAKQVDLQAMFIEKAGALGADSLLYSLNKNQLVLYTEGIDGRFHDMAGSKLATEFPLLSGVHYLSVIEYQFIHHVENCISLKTLLRSSPTFVQYAQNVTLLPPE